MYLLVLCLTTVLLNAQAYSVNTDNQNLEDWNTNIPPECVGKELCLTKPVDYPTEDIERIAKKLIKRWKRHNFINYIPQDNDDSDPNNCATSRGISQPYLLIRNQSKHFVIQSSSFSQTVPTISCKTETSQCFQDLLLPSVRAGCRTKYATFSLTVYVPSSSKVEQIESQFPIDCGCEVETTF